MPPPWGGGPGGTGREGGGRPVYPGVPGLSGGSGKGLAPAAAAATVREGRVLQETSPIFSQSSRGLTGVGKMFRTNAKTTPRGLELAPRV